MAKQNSEAPKPFPLRRRAKEAGRNGVWWGAAAGFVAFLTLTDPTQIISTTAVTYFFATGAYLDGAYVAHKNDDPLPVFDKNTILLFDTVLTIVCLLLFVEPAFQLDYTYRHNSVLPNLPGLPGWFGFAAMFLSAFLIPVTRGLICNLGLAREEDDETSEHA